MYQNIYIEKTEEGDVVHLFDDQHEHQEFSYSSFRYAYRPSAVGDRVTLYGNKVKKITRWGENEPSLFESDISRELRVLSDLYLDSDTPSVGHIVLIFDIEVSMVEGIPNVERAENPIYSIAVEDSVTKERILFIVDSDHKIVGAPANWRIFDSEQDLLLAFLDYYEQIHPTIVSGWNCDYFDIPYLYRRLERVFDLDTANRLSPIGRIKWVKFRSRWQIAGVSVLDYLALYKKFTYQERPSYRLGVIGEIELDLPKIEYDETLDDLYTKDRKKFGEYNLRDVEIVSRLDAKKRLIELVRGICHIGHVPYEDFSYSSRFLDGTILVYLHRKNIVVPDRPRDGRERMEELGGDEGFEGAYVKEPVPGRYEWIYSLDLQSLYPSIMMSLNISPETKVGKVLNWDIQEYQRGKIGDLQLSDLRGSRTSLTKEEFDRFMREGKFTISANGVMYRTDVAGVVPEILENWFNARMEMQALQKEHDAKGNKEEAAYYDMRQQIQKIFLNSLYGVIGLPIFRYYDNDNAAAVTLTGQEVIRTSEKFVNREYANAIGSKEDRCIYVDTDSLYFSSKSLPYSFDDRWKEHTIEVARDMETKLNAFYPDMTNYLFFSEKCRFKIKGEAVASSGFWVAKKRYALRKIYDLSKNKPVDTVVVKGLDIVRSSFAPAFRTLMNEVLMDILQSVPKEKVDERIREFKHRMANFDVADIARNTSVKELSKFNNKSKVLNDFDKGTPVHAKAALSYNRMLVRIGAKKYEPITDGLKIKWVYLRSDNPLKIDALAFKGYDDPPKIVEFIREYVDRHAVFESELKTKLQDFYTAMQWGLIATDVNTNANKFFVYD